MQGAPTHLSADRRCRPLSFVLTPGQAADDPRFIPVPERIKVRGSVGRPRVRPDAVVGHDSRGFDGGKLNQRPQVARRGRRR
ncbi:hypothetical protein ACIA98_24200 [Streptomyces sp. NPDC051366]|uniref:hypothetical protein n=1 Tax=Streptomyces sp. NPDC051366 TaxID=3365652 RepID=UPI00378CE8ED